MYIAITKIILTEMKWEKTIACLGEYSEFLEATAKAKMPSYWELKKNISFYLVINTTTFEICFKAPEYWKWAEEGRKPGKFPPPNAISKWITRRKITPYPMRDGRIPTKPQLTYLISRKIARDGTTGIHFLKASLEEQEAYWEGRLKSALSEDIEKEIISWLSPLEGPTII